MRGRRRTATAHTDGPTLLLKPDRPRGIDRHIDYFGSASSRDRFRDWAGTLLGERRSFVLRGRSARGVDTHQHVAENGGGCERWGAALRILQDEATEQDAAVKAAEQALSLITIQYKAGTVSYLNVIVAQATALSNEITAVAILGRRMVAAALLVKALGGGWSADNLPSTSEFLEPAPRTGRDARRPGAPPDGIGFMAR